MRINRRLSAIAGSLLLMAGSATMAQDVALKTNVLYDLTLSPNLGVEIGLAPKWSLDVTGEFNLWTIKNHKWKHYFVQPEARYWLCERFDGHFFGLNVIGGEYSVGTLPLDFKFLNSNFDLRHQRYRGWGLGAGIAYGYAWPVHKHWNIEAEIGIGWIWTKYDIYAGTNSSRKLASDRIHNYVGPTKAAVNVVYLF